MRVTAETKEYTRRRIVDTARKLFAEQGFERTTTRDLASAAGIAAGTLFNYFSSKEALALHIVASALDEGRRDFDRRRRGDEGLVEDLFRLVMTGLRRLEPHRGFVGVVVETALSPFARGGLDDAERLRRTHVETVANLLVLHGFESEPSFVAMHLYWTLYLGVLAFWSRDTSEHQEETLSVLDQSVRLFVASLKAGKDRAEENHVT